MRSGCSACGCATSSVWSGGSPGSRHRAIAPCAGSRLPLSRGIYLCGHSAGAHLAAMVLSTDWSQYGVVPDIKGSAAVSRTGVCTRDEPVSAARRAVGAGDPQEMSCRS